MRCPCNRNKCRNKQYLDENTVKVHLEQHGFVPGYHRWIHHGEEYIRPSLSYVNFSEVPSHKNLNLDAENVFRNVTENILDSSIGDTNYYHEGPSSFYQNVDEHISFNFNDNINAATTDTLEISNEYAKNLFDNPKSAESEIWRGNPHGITQLSLISEILQMKAQWNMSESNMDQMCQLMSKLCPKENNVSDSFYSTKKLISELGLPVEKIDSYQNNCMIYWGADSNLIECKVCQHPKYKPQRSRTRRGSKLIPFKQMYYFPLTPRLQRLYASDKTASHMSWNFTHVQESDLMTHHSDSLAWKHFDQTNPSFAIKSRNVRLGLSTDGFQPFGQSGQQYSSWPVILTPYNLPSWMCMKDGYMFLTVIVPGPSNPKDKLDVFLQPLVAELKDLWYNGAMTYDVHSKTNFTMRAALMWMSSDFSAYAMLFGWSTEGKLACPYCMDSSESFSLPYSGKTSWFDNHSKFLPMDHPLRRNRHLFLSGQRFTNSTPPIKTGEQLLNDIDEYGFLPAYEVDADELNKEIHTVASCGWRRRSILWELPYWSKNLIRHNLDVMHIEKNIFDNLFNTVMNVPRRTKDNEKSREDIKLLCNRAEPHQDEDTGHYPKASYTLDRRGNDVLCSWLNEVKFPDGLISKLSRRVDMSRLCMFGMKSHDCHVFMQRLIPVEFKELLPKNVWEVLTELSLLFSSFTTRNVRESDLS
ncbi:uncharacterized protein [Henckelia pumila]|uniref:uncharacterized protein n=1 Tax=Henckelia pumila TaxID=405737 RepID=UPI003C6DE18B